MYKGSDGRKYSVQEAAHIAEGRHSYFACYYHQDRLYDFLCWTRLHLNPFYSREDAEKYLHEYAIRNHIELCLRGVHDDEKADEADLLHDGDEQR